MDDSTATVTALFRFASGQVLTLDEDTIHKIPYLAAMISTADKLKSARDENGYYKLDPRIEYKQFCFLKRIEGTD